MIGWTSFTSIGRLVHMLLWITANTFLVWTYYGVRRAAEFGRTCWLSASRTNALEHSVVEHHTGWTAGQLRLGLVGHGSAVGGDEYGKEESEAHGYIG